MYLFIKKIVRLIFGRVARNIYLWTIFFLALYSSHDTSDYPYTASEFFFLVMASFLIYASALYINNLWLLPFFLKKRRYIQYTIIVVCLVIIYAFIFTYYNYWFDKHFPLGSFSDISFTSLGSNDVYKEVNKDPAAFFELMIWAAFSYACFILMFSTAWFMSDYFIQQKRLDEAIKEKMESELALMKHQVSPHFLFNTLNNLYGLSLVKSDHLSESLLQLSHILRYLIYDSNSSLIAFDREKEVMEAYINLELLRLSNTKNLKFTITSDKNYDIPPLLWLAVLENIFKHGTRQINNDAQVDFNFTIENNRLQIHSQNSFQKPALNHKGAEGFGLENLKKRLGIIYPKKHLFKETVNSDVYELFISIDLS